MDSIRVTQSLGVTNYDKNEASAVIYPNPISENSVIEINSSTNDMTEFSILNMNGVLVDKKIIEVKQGVNKIRLTDFELVNLSNGVYFLLMKNNDVISQKRFLIVN